MERQVQGAGVALACEVQGAGPPVLLVHGLGDAREGWRETAAALAGEATVITYDRRGYGASEAPEPYERTTVEEQAEDAAAAQAGEVVAQSAVLFINEVSGLVAPVVV